MYSFIVGCQNELKWNFFDGHFWRAMFESDAIRGHKHAGAIGALSTMNKDRCLRALCNRSEKFGHLFIASRRPTIPWNEQEFHSQFFGLFLLGFAFMTRFAA